MKKNPFKRTARASSKKKKAPSPVVPNDEEIRDLESRELPKRIKEEVCQEVAEKLGISFRKVRGFMEKLESGIPARRLNK